MSRAAALDKMREAKRLLAEAERELQEPAADDPAPRVAKRKVTDLDRARARKNLRRLGY